MNIEKLYDIGEWCAAGLLEGEQLPFPRAYGLAYRRLYENMPVSVSDTIMLVPFEPFYCCRSGGGDVMNGGLRSGGQGKEHHAVSYIVNPFHSSGLELRRDIAEEKKRLYPAYAEFIDELTEYTNKFNFERYGYIHSNPDIYEILERGFNYKISQIKSGIISAKNEKDETGLNFLLAMEDYADGIVSYYNNIKKAIAAAVNKADGDRKKKLSVISDEFTDCFLKPAESFIGGLLTVNLMWMLDGCDSIGRLDYALGSLFEADLASGRLDINFARELLDNIWQMFNLYNGWNLQIGGSNPDGSSCYNTLTRELLLCDLRMHMRRPNLALRVTSDMPDDIYKLAFEDIISGTGKPALYNEELYLKQLKYYFPHIPYEDLVMYGFGGCTETMITGLSCVDSLLAAINMAQIFEKTVYNYLTESESFDDFLSYFKNDILTFTDKCVNEWTQGIISNSTSHDPKIMRSMFTRDCIVNRRSFEDGGARYNWSVISYDGTTTVVDSLAAIKHCIFDTKQVSKRKLVDALKSNFEGYSEIKARLDLAPKYGNDNTEADVPGAQIIRYAWEYLLSKFTPRGKGGRFIPSVILFATYEGSGKCVGATSDGRLAGTPLNDSVGAYRGCDKKGPTALINSVLRLPLECGIGTPVFNIRLNKSFLFEENGKKNTITLVKSFFDRGGMQLQFSVVDTAEMRAAQKNPEKYRNLIVRIGGYSEYFIYLSPVLQETVIKRSEN
ncbi:MAG: pyruvate formate lyase family protein [Eubacteriales bacterium]